MPSSGSFRAWGRAYLLHNARDIIHALTNAVNRLRANALTNEMMERGYNLNGNNINVYVVASLAGGTGSSVILDITRLLQKAGINVRYYTDAGMDHIFGMFFLPKFFEGKPYTDNIFRNAYTALSELDYTLGLADQTRHSPESREIDNDRQDYHGNPSMGERVAYDGVFLIDAVNSMGNRLTLHEASSNVASFIASSMAADYATLMSCHVNSQHKFHHVRGKYQNYSGLGYCELRFNRQELVKHLLNRKLLECLQQFKTGENRLTSNHIAERFINENHLNEGVMCDEEGVDTRAQLNELTDAIIDMTDRRLVSLAMTEVNPSKHAIEDLRGSFSNYMNQISMTAHEMVMDFAGRKRELLQRLRNLMDEHMKGYGFGDFPDLVMHLKDIITDMRRGLEDEMQMHEEQFHRMECRELLFLQKIIEENSRNILFLFPRRREQLADVIQQYFDKVRFDNGSPYRPTLAWLKVEMIRKGEAIAVFEEMRNVLDGYYKEEIVETLHGAQANVTGSYNSVHHFYHRFKEQLIHELNNYRPSKRAINSTIFADAYFKEYFEKHDAVGMVLDTRSMTELNNYFASLFASQPQVNEATLAAMREKLLSLLPENGTIRKIQSGYLSIDELFILCFGNYVDIRNTRDFDANPQLRLLEEVNSLATPMWSYMRFGGQGLDQIVNQLFKFSTSKCHYQVLRYTIYYADIRQVDFRRSGA